MLHNICIRLQSEISNLRGMRERDFIIITARDYGLFLGGRGNTQQHSTTKDRESGNSVSHFHRQQPGESSLGPLLVMQRFHRIQLRCAIRGYRSKDNSHQHGDGQSDDGGEAGNRNSVFGEEAR